MLVGRLRNGRLIFSLHRTSNCFRPTIPSLSFSLFLLLPSSQSLCIRWASFHSHPAFPLAHPLADSIFLALLASSLIRQLALLSLHTALVWSFSFSLFSSFSSFLSPLFLFSLLLFLRSWACKRSGRCPCFSRPETPTHRGSVRGDAQWWERPPHETSFNRIKKCNSRFLPINVSILIDIQFSMKSLLKLLKFDFTII